VQFDAIDFVLEQVNYHKVVKLVSVFETRSRLLNLESFGLHVLKEPFRVLRVLFDDIHNHIQLKLIYLDVSEGLEEGTLPRQFFEGFLHVRWQESEIPDNC